MISEAKEEGCMQGAPPTASESAGEECSQSAETGNALTSLFSSSHLLIIFPIVPIGQRANMPSDAVHTS